MFGWFKRKPAASAGDALREVLFGDVPLGDWAGQGAEQPWQSFRAAADAIDAGDTAAARNALQAVLAQRGLESRHYVQAWTELRSLGVTPSAEEAKHVYGVVLDVPMARGLDTLAAYEDGSARYLNHAGGAVVWDTPGTDAEMDALVEAFLAAGRTVVSVIGPWEHARPPLPAGQARVSMLTPGGLYFGQGPLDVLSKEPLAAPVFAAGTALMVALVRRAGVHSSG